MDNQSRVFAAVLPAAGRESSGNENERGLRTSPSGNRLREVQVTGTAEVCCPADRVSVRVSVGSSKESVNEVTSSVSRRLEYILQAVRQHGVSDKDTSVRRFLHREADQYNMDAEVVVTFSDFEKMEQVCNVLLEKLDKSVCVGTPLFFHSAECLSQMRQRACVSAVENAQQKACEVSSWGRLWDLLYWSERRRQGSGGMRMKRAEARPVLTFPVHLQSLPRHGCLCPSASETEAGKNFEDFCL